MGDALPAPGALIGGRFRIESLLGQGAMGAVLAAIDEATGRAVAIKWMLPRTGGSEEAYTRFMAEARAMARIEHPNVIAILDVGREDGSPFLVMERLRGESLHQRIEGTRLSVTEALDIVIPACRGVAEAHRERVIHRDLKPDNIFLCEAKDGSPRAPKVLDFGVAKLVEGVGPSMTKSGVALGTPSFMAPEQIGTPREIDVRVDVYAMAVVLYRVLSGRLPYEGDGIYELILRISQGSATPLRTLAPDVPPALEATIARAMSIEREHRHASMGELLSDLEGIRARVGDAGPAIQAPLQMPRGGTVPLDAVSPAGERQPSSRPPPSRPPRARPRSASKSTTATAQRGSKTAVGLIIGAAVLGLAGSAIGAGHWLRRREDRGPGTERSGAALAGTESLVPRVDLRFSGDCHPRFDGRVAVMTSDHPLLSLVSVLDDREVGSLMIVPYEGALRGPVSLTPPSSGSPELTVHIGDLDTRSWSNQAPGPAGTLTFRRYEPAHGVMDVTFDDVVLRGVRSEGVCRVQGRVQTFALTRGSP